MCSGQTDKTHLDYDITMNGMIRWVIIGAVSAIAVCLFAFVGSPHTVTVRAMYSILIYGTGVVAIMAIFLTPAWISISCMLVKKAIESAQNNNYKEVHFYLFSRGWAIFPRSKYSEIIRILRHLCKDRRTKPEGISSKFSEYIVVDDSGNYGLSLEGKNKMIKIVDTGWLTAKKAEDFTSTKTLKCLMWLVLAVAIIRGIAVVIHMFIRH
jgi:hypothetical protein